jgi:hypothetical protein
MFGSHAKRPEGGSACLGGVAGTSPFLAVQLCCAAVAAFLAKSSKKWQLATNQ